MRIGFDAKRAFQNRTGLGNYSRTLISNLAQYFPEDELYLYSPSTKVASGVQFSPAGSQIHLKGPDSIFYRGLPGVWRSFGIPKDVQTDRVSIYHGLSHELPFNIGSTKSKTVVTIHDLIYFKHPEWFPWIDRQVYDQKFRFSTRRASHIVAVSEKTKQDLVEHFKISPDKISVVYQSAQNIFYSEISQKSIDALKTLLQLKGKSVLYVGSLIERKNALQILKALYYLRGHCPFTLLLVGEGKAYRKILEQFIKERGLEESVQFLGALSSEELAVLYRSVDALVYPSLAEGFGLPVLEAVLSKLPVITSRGSCMAEIGGEFLHYVDPGDLGELSNTLELVLGSGPTAKKLADKAYAQADRFHPRQTAQKLHQLYLDIV